MKDRFLFSVCPPGEFFGRTVEIGYIVDKASGGGLPHGIFLTGKRWTGKTEVLRRVHASLFWEQARVLPVYYQFKYHGGIEIFAEDYLREVLRQFLAFRRRDPGLLGWEFTLDRLSSMLAEEKDLELSEFISIHRDAKKSGDLRAVLRNAAGVPKYISERTGIPVYLMLDDIDYGASLLAGEGPCAPGWFMDQLSGSFSFIATCTAKKGLEGVGLDFAEDFRLGGLVHEEAVAMMTELCHRYGVEFDNEVLSLAVARLEGNPMYMKNLVRAACRDGADLLTLKGFVCLYASELFDGNIGRALRSSMRLKGLDGLKALNAIASKAVPEEEMAGRFGALGERAAGVIDDLASEGFVEADFGSIRWTGGATARDFVRYNYETRASGRSIEEVRASMISDGLKEGFNLKGAAVRYGLHEDVAGLLKSFNGQRVDRALFGARAFPAACGGEGLDAARSGGKARVEEIALPQVIGCFDSSAWEKSETGPRIMIARGFLNDMYDEGSEVVWITAVKDSFSPVNAGDADSFLRRSRILRENFKAMRVFRWFVGGEGFTAEALKKLEAEAVFLTDGAQARALRDSIESGQSTRAPLPGKATSGKEFEVVLPAAAKAELVAARAAGEIGSEMGFDDTAIGQIKAALIEACINAFEHSMVKEGKVFLRFVAGSDRLVIHVQNRGVDFNNASVRPPDAAGSGGLRKRGWGLEIINGLMDEVRFEKIKGGAKVVMAKYLLNKGDARDAQA